jgi:hypothetical protein
MATSLKDIVRRQRDDLAALLADPLARLAGHCAACWPDRDALDAALTRGLEAMPWCTFLYALDADGIQISDNASHEGLLPEHYGRDRSHRPYLAEVVPARDFLLSDAYLSLRAHRPSLTAIQLVRRGGRVVGYLGADFDLRNLPLTRSLYAEPDHWRQIKGDPVIRGQVFQQSRAESRMDRHLDDVLGVLRELYAAHGMFHCSVHFSSSRATIWLMEDPFRYRILGADDLVDPDICLAYPVTPYSPEAVVPRRALGDILEGFRTLRLADDTIYLRSGSLNIFNGMIRLTFSCDGSHYVRWDEFLGKGMDFWGVGSAAG